MMKAVQFALVRLANVLAYAVIAGVAWAALLILETRLWPVLTDVQPLQITRDTDDDILFRFKFDKQRNCRLVGLDWYAGTPLSDPASTLWRPAPAFIPAGADSPSDLTYRSRSVGEHVSGVIEIRLPANSREHRQFYGILRYGCGFPWVTVQLLGPFAAPRTNPSGGQRD